MIHKDVLDEPKTSEGVISASKEFASALFDASVQTPYNLVTKLAKNAGADLPEIDLVPKQVNGTVASEMGSWTGVAVDLLLLSRLTGFKSAFAPTKVNEGLTVDKLETAFGAPLTRVRLRWDLLQDMKAPISTQVIFDREKLKDLYHPWYNNPSGKIVGWDSVDAKPLSVLDVANKSGAITNERLSHINEVGAALKSFDGPVQLTALAYRVPGNKHLLLDSNHRIAALAQENLPFRLILHSVEGPVHGKYLPDLVQFTSGANPLATRAQAIEEVKKINGW